MITKSDLINYPDAYDINWYLVSKEGYLMFFSSSGGVIPLTVLENYEYLDSLNIFFENLQNTSISKLNPFLLTIKQFHSKKDYQNYINYYDKWSSNGFYTFDKTKDDFPNDTNYHLVTYPQSPLQIDTLPKSVKEDLLNFQVGISIHNIQTLDWSTFLDTP